MAITHQRAAFAANKVEQIVALGLLYTLNMVTNFSIFFTSVWFSHTLVTFIYFLQLE